ncbi:MAG: DUF2637 domain-containing protein [Micromonospora sp.]
MATLTPTAIASRAAAAVVAAVAGTASYRHIYDVATGAGEHRGVAAVLPLAIDGLIVVATLAMLEDKRQERRPRLAARLALAFGVTATLAANVASAQPTATARLVAAIPAISFLLAVEVLSQKGKPMVKLASPQAPAVEPPPAEVVVAEPPVAVEPSRPGIAPETAVRIAAAMAAKPGADRDEVAATAGVSARTVRRYLAANPA